MKQVNLFFFVLVAPGLLLAQGSLNQNDAQGRRHGLWQKSYPNGEIRYTGRFVHGTPVDTFRYYFENGDLRTINVFRGKSGNCLSFQYGDGEKLAAVGLFRQKEKDSVWTYYDADGNVVSREPYARGRVEGEVRTFYPSGQVAEVKPFKNGEQTGDWKRFYPSGKPMSKGQYREGTLHGEVIYYHSNGKPRLKGHYVNGLMHGVWYHFSSDLKLEKKEVWRYGFLQVDRDKEDTTVAPLPFK